MRFAALRFLNATLDVRAPRADSARLIIAGASSSRVRLHAYRTQEPPVQREATRAACRVRVPCSVTGHVLDQYRLIHSARHLLHQLLPVQTSACSAPTQAAIALHLQRVPIMVNWERIQVVTLLRRQHAQIPASSVPTQAATAHRPRRVRTLERWVHILHAPRHRQQRVRILARLVSTPSVRTRLRRQQPALVLRSLSRLHLPESHQAVQAPSLLRVPASIPPVPSRALE